MNTTFHPREVARRATRRPMMTAVLQQAYGSANVLTVGRVERPALGESDVLVRVRAASVNHADWVYTSGRPLLARLAFGLRAPKSVVRGKDVAGVVEAVGAAVTRFRAGDPVYGEAEAGSFAEYVAVPEDLLAAMPATLTFEQAATVPLAGRTALQALSGTAQVRPGQRVLINGASGGVGTFAVQIAVALGGAVTAVCSSRNAGLVRSLGASQIIDYSAADFTAASERYDVILDLIGNHSLTRLRKALSPGGMLVLSSGTGGRVLGPMLRIVRALALSPFVSQKFRVVAASSGVDALDRLRGLIEAGEVTPAVDRVYPLSDAPEAIRYFAEEHASGKIVIAVSASES